MLSELLRSAWKIPVTAEEAAKTIFNGLKAAGISLIATLPDINLAELLHEVEADRDVIHVPLVPRGRGDRYLYWRLFSRKEMRSDHAERGIFQQQ